MDALTFPETELHVWPTTELMGDPAGNKPMAVPRRPAPASVTAGATPEVTPGPKQESKDE